MTRHFVRLGVLPSLFLGATLFVTGLTTMFHIVDNWWPFDVQRLDLVRATALDRVDAALLLDAANKEIIFAFLAAVLIASAGLVLPLAYVLNKRFADPADKEDTEASGPQFTVVFRQSMWVGLWIAVCVWLQMNRVLGVAVAGLVAVVLVLFELKLQIRSRAESVAAS